MRFLILCSLVLLNLAASAADHPKTGSENEPPRQIYVASGALISGSGVPIQLHSLRAIIEDGGTTSSGKGSKPSNENQKVIRIASGTAFLSNHALGILLNTKLAQRGLKEAKVSNDKGQVKITGTAKKTIPVPFTIEGPVALTPKGYIRLDTKKMDVAKLPGLAGLLGIDPEKVVGGSVKGVEAEKNEITFDPDLLWGLPIHGRVIRLAYESNGLLLVFGGVKGNTPKPSTTQASIIYLTQDNHAITI